MKLPDAFVRRTRTLLPEEYDLLEQAILSDSPVSIRCNREKGNISGTDFERVPWSQTGFYLPERIPFTFDPLFHAGAYYVQEASSMFLGHIIRQYIHDPVRYLDLCAAPGGKTTDALSSLPEGSLVVSNELMRSRAHILAENVIKWGNPSAIVTRNEPSDFSSLHHYFDVIATDVPCSGEGMFRKDKEAISEWSPENVIRCADRQKNILRDIWSALRPGGLLIYSTCTYNTEENEEMILFLQKQFGAIPLPVKTHPEWSIKNSLLGDIPVYRFMPHLTRGEGLFMTILRKPENSEATSPGILFRENDKATKRKQNKENSPAVPEELKRMLLHPDRFDFIHETNTFTAFPSIYRKDYQLLRNKLQIIHAGIPIAQQKGKDLIPCHALALSTSLNLNYTDKAEIDLPTAISYLRREGLQLSSDLPRGYLLLTYQGHPIGWVKNVGNRANNLYPQEWRIRSGYIPQELKSVAISPKNGE